MSIAGRRFRRMRARLRTFFSTRSDRKSTRLNSSHTEIYTLSLHDALPIWDGLVVVAPDEELDVDRGPPVPADARQVADVLQHPLRSEEHTSELQSHRDLHSFPTRRSSDLGWSCSCRARRGTGCRSRAAGSGGCAPGCGRSSAPA